MENNILTCEAIARKLWGEPAKQERDELYWMCPFHTDHHPSLKINRAKNIFSCFACGRTGTALQLAADLAGIDRGDGKGIAQWLDENGLQSSEFKKSAMRRGRPKLEAEIIREHIYTLEDGTPVARKVRWGSFNPSQDEKLRKSPGFSKFSWYRRENNEWVKGLSQEKQDNLPFYREPWPKEAGMTLENPILLTEGEHDADSGAALGFNTTTTGGTKSFKQKHAEILRGKHVVILPHSDTPGQSDGQMRAALLFPLAASVRVISTYPKKDLAEMVDSGLTREALAALIADTPTWEPETLAQILVEVMTALTKYIKMDEDQAVFCTLWAAHTHAMKAFDYTPYLSISSSDTKCGKTHLMLIIGYFSSTPMNCTTISVSAMFRAIEKWQPTLLMDEADNLLAAQDDLSDALRGVLNSGHQRGMFAVRSVGQGDNLEPRKFPVFGAKVFTHVKALPDSTMTRAMKIRLKPAGRRAIPHFRPSKVEKECAGLRAKLEAAIVSLVARLSEMEIDMPEELDGREADICEPLVAIADLAGHGWPDLARSSMIHLSIAGAESGDSLQKMLITDIRKIFDGEDLHPGDESLAKDRCDEISSANLVKRLVDMEERPWAEMPRSHKAITQNTLARMLRVYDIQPGHIWDGDRKTTFRCYLRSMFIESWEGFLGVKSDNE
jgi:hypothetical protein